MCRSTTNICCNFGSYTYINMLHSFKKKHVSYNFWRLWLYDTARNNSSRPTEQLAAIISPPISYYYLTTYWLSTYYFIYFYLSIYYLIWFN